MENKFKVGQLFKVETGEVFKIKTIEGSEFTARVFGLNGAWTDLHMKGALSDLDGFLSAQNGIEVNPEDYPERDGREGHPIPRNVERICRNCGGTFVTSEDTDIAPCPRCSTIVNPKRDGREE